VLCVPGLQVCAFVRVVLQLGTRGRESLGRQGNLPPYAGSAYRVVQPSCPLASWGYSEEEEAVPFDDDLKMDMTMMMKKMKAS